MKKSLIIVESPAKIKTLKKLLGNDFVFSSSIGHVVDLPAKEFGIDIENNFEPQYQVLPDKKDVIKNIKQLASQCEMVYLSPDPDREGEAIAWHIANQLPKNTKIQRVCFNAITKTAVTEALKTPREIDIALVNAQQARRLLDRIVGYKISPILSRKLQQRSGISAGRVQSVALKLVVDREKDIENFKPQEYWILKTLLLDPKSQQSFWASLYSVEGKKWEKEASDKKDTFIIDNAEKASHYINLLASSSYQVSKVDSKQKKRQPHPPFITSTLQQEASRHFRFSASRTMSIAQTLYEGIELENGEATGLITYMRTDSVRIDPEALQATRQYILDSFGKDYLPEKANLYATKKMAQDAHEAIRPTDVKLSPEKIASFLSPDQLKLYSLIWKRFVASQMLFAIYDTLSVKIITNTDIEMRASGSVLKFKGFLTLYDEKQDEETSEAVVEILPPLQPNDVLSLEKTSSDQSFTKPLPRFTEASLVKELEKSGIGRPSTYATIMNKIQSREYTVKENLRLKPTELGKIISHFLETNFANIMNISFTANMENDLELIADNKKPWKELIKTFWEQFYPLVTTAEKEASIPRIVTDKPCAVCEEGKLVKIWSKDHYFYGCSNYPECSYKISEDELSFNKDDYAEDTDWSAPCPICRNPTKLRHGRFGSFLGCLDYPTCRGTINLRKKNEPIEEAEEETPCPAINCPGILLKKKSRYNKYFYSCSQFPNCNVIGNTVDQILDKYQNHPQTPYQKTKKASPKSKSKKTTAKKTTKARAQPTFLPSKELAAITGSDPITRGDATKKLWSYIKKEQLQSPDNKRLILAEKKLKPIIGDEPIDMLQLAKKLSPHLSKG